MRLLLSLLASALFLLTLPACKGSCRQLSEKLCECAGSSLAKEDCLRRVSAQEVEVTVEQETHCAALLPQCDCHLVDTAEGKVRCGLARPKPGT